MDQAITYRTATVEDALTICELGQLLNAIHHAVRPDIYTAATQDFSRDLPHWMSFRETDPGCFHCAYRSPGCWLHFRQPVDKLRSADATAGFRSYWIGVRRRAILGKRYWSSPCTTRSRLGNRAQRQRYKAVGVDVQCPCNPYVHRVGVRAPGTRDGNVRVKGIPS